MKSPTMLYKHPGQHEIHESNFDFIIVDECDVQQAIKDGWFLTTDAAKSNDKQPYESESTNRQEMIQKAESLGIKVDKRWSDETLISKVSQIIDEMKSEPDLTEQGN